MRFSIVCASYLGDYRNAAKGRDKKIVRAVNSVLDQTFTDFELIVVADGCEKTVKIMSEYDDPRIRTFAIPKGRMWSGDPRNKGIDEAKGEFILYLDNDDMFGENHLQTLNDKIGTFDWVWFDDIRYDPRSKKWYQNPCNINQIGSHGTSNVCHKKSGARWDHDGYAHDYYFVVHLKENKNFAKVDAGEYYCCHIPGAGGYDL